MVSAGPATVALDRPRSADACWSGQSFRTRYVYKLLDAFLIAPLRPAVSSAALAGALLRPRSSHFNRAAALMNLVSAVAPGLGRRIRDSLYRPGRLPLPAVGDGPLGFGSGVTVFRCGGDAGNYVLKVYRLSLGCAPRVLLERARAYRERYARICSWYAGVDGLVPPSSHLVIQAPLLGLPAVACLQPYLAGERHDLFAEHADKDLLELLERDEEFRNRFVAFAQATLRLRDTQGLCIDLLGHGNLSVVRAGGQASLSLIDFGLFDFEERRLRTPVAYAAMEALLGRMRRLLAAVPQGCRTSR